MGLRTIQAIPKQSSRRFQTRAETRLGSTLRLPYWWWKPTYRIIVPPQELCGGQFGARGALHSLGDVIHGLRTSRFGA